ncbi:hypothetical protein ACFQ9Y_26275 [Peribacillus simplex]|uniref:hypothetical protein n=1 Tax=Peribacillus simplex TaxID=1478 RepID=UPI0036700CDE
MESKAFYELIAVLRNKNVNYKLEAFIEKYNLEDIIKAFKGNGIGVNAYPDSNEYAEYLNIIPKVYAKASLQYQKQAIDKYNDEIKTLNKLFEDFYSKDQFKEVTQINDEKKLFSFLIATEFYIRALKDLKFKNGENRDYYGDVDIQRNVDGKPTGIKELSANQFTDAIDYLSQQASKVVQAFIFYGYLYNDKFKSCKYDNEIDWSDIEKSFTYFSLIDLRAVLFDLFEDWKFGNYEVLEVDENNIKIIPKDLKSFLDENLEIQRFESSRYSITASYKARNESKKEVSLVKALAPKAFLDEIEEISYKEYLEFFSSEKLDYKVNGIEIVKWLRAYAVVRYYNQEFLKVNVFPYKIVPDNWLYVSTYDEWIQLFINHGIDQKSAEIICDKFTFKKNSVDWFDSPFIEINEKVLTLPSIVSNSQDVLALISMATKENMNLDFKGYCFEDRILHDLNKNKIPAVSIKRKVSNEEYQCDIAFILGRDLFLCECKHTAQPITQRKRYDFYNRKVPEDVEQTNRICDFYSSNVKFIIEDFNKKIGSNYTLHWKPRRIYRMVIYSCKLVGNLKLDGVIITDYTILATLIYRRLPTFWKEGVPVKQIMPPKMKGVFQGEVTSNKLLNFLEKPWQMDFQRAVTKVEDEKIIVNKLNLHMKKTVRTIDNFYELKD